MRRLKQTLPTVFLVIVMAVPAVSALAQPPAPQLPPLANDLIQMRRINATATRCGWHNPLTTAVLKAAEGQKQAEVALLGEAVTQQVALIATQMMAADGQSACSGPASDQARQEIVGAMNQLLAEWVVRMDSMIALGVAEPWAANLTTLGSHKPALEPVVAQIKAANGAAFPQAQAAMGQESRVVLGLICEERKAVRAPTPRTCPAVSPADKPKLALARAMVTGAEALAPAFTAQRAAAAPPAINPTDYFRWTSVGGFGLTGGGACKAGDLVIKPNAAGEGTFPLMRFGEFRPVGQVSVGNNNGQITLLRPDGDASMAGVGGLGTFSRCPPG